MPITKARGIPSSTDVGGTDDSELQEAPAEGSGQIRTEPGETGHAIKMDQIRPYDSASYHR